MGQCQATVVQDFTYSERLFLVVHYNRIIAELFNVVRYFGGEVDDNAFNEAYSSVKRRLEQYDNTDAYMTLQSIEQQLNALPIPHTQGARHALNRIKDIHHYIQQYVIKPPWTSNIGYVDLKLHTDSSCTQKIKSVNCHPDPMVYSPSTRTMYHQKLNKHGHVIQYYPCYDKRAITEYMHSKASQNSAFKNQPGYSPYPTGFEQFVAEAATTTPAVINHFKDLELAPNLVESNRFVPKSILSRIRPTNCLCHMLPEDACSATDSIPTEKEHVEEQPKDEPLHVEDSDDPIEEDYVPPEFDEFGNPFGMYDI